MTDFLIACCMVLLAAWIQAERVIREQRKALEMSRRVIECQDAAQEELQEAFHAACVERPSSDLSTLTAWGMKVH